MRSNQRGFSLLEILVAFTILALAMGVLMQIFSGGIRNTELSGRYAQAVALAQSLLVPIGVETPLDEGERNGEFADSYRWRVQIRRHEEPSQPGTIPESRAASLFALIEVNVRVDWGGGSNDPQARSVSITTLRLRPQAAP